MAIFNRDLFVNKNSLNLPKSHYSPQNILLRCDAFSNGSVIAPDSMAISPNHLRCKA
jgi:hypothetical protein